MSDFQKKLVLVITGVLIFISLSLRIPVYFPKDIKSRAQIAQLVYSDLIKYTGVPGIYPEKIQIADSEEINAWASVDGVTITTGMLKFIHSTDEIAGVIGHEIGHIILGHTIVEDGIDQRVKEANADKYGTYLMLKGGYDVCQERNIWVRFVQTYGNGILTQSHPSEIDRIDALTFPQCQ